MYTYSIIITRNGQEIKKFLDFLPVLSIYFSIECQLLLEVKNLVWPPDSLKVFFHCAPSSVQDLLENERHRLFKHDTLTDYLETIRQKLSYKKWYFGHYHDNKNLTEKGHLLYKQIIKLGDNVP